MPVSAIWIVEAMRLELRAASASTAITASGLTWATMPRRISAVSIPVTPSTPGAAAHTLLIGTSRGRQSPMCRVTSTRSAVLGPSESGVTLRLPSPTTSAVFMSGGSMPQSVCASSAASARRVSSETVIACSQASVI